MMAQVTGIYDEPGLYQLACAYRDVPAEAGALLAWCAEHYRGDSAAATGVTGSDTGSDTGTGTVRSVLELAAGPAEHARELARRGLRATALDHSPAMCAYAAAQAKVAGVDLDVVEADMRDFRLSVPDYAEPDYAEADGAEPDYAEADGAEPDGTEADGAPRRFDLAITMLNSACHLFTLDDLVPHLTAVAAHLVAGGLYVVELAHPADFFAPVQRTSSDWTVDVDGVHAPVHWGGRQDRIDPLTQVTAEHMTITATAADGTVRTVSDVVPNRFWTLTEFTAAVRLANAAGAGLTLAASYGDFDTVTPLDAPAAWRMILILRRS
jgi:SAM-dependent methyltransferase